ncbi:uncharacterized protein LOC132917282 isoform X1 [Rhopalosiphum padi]|uniref:uncharacterized protein LOC132917282 isoform X1 n=1 Tax=Rhopalosiphum padi TaxID=40932 RepID=UPI00298DC30D|nr:uncharacterized protein LOC132917282 isoform X1 [Rhopalosiphum padi]
MKTFILINFVLFFLVLWPMIADSHNKNSIVKNIYRSNISQIVDLNVSYYETFETTSAIQNDNITTSETIRNESNILFYMETSSTPVTTTLIYINGTNEVNTFQSTLPDQNYGNFVMVFFLSAIIILILGLLFIIIYNKIQQGSTTSTIYQVREIYCHNHQETAV